MGIKYLSNIDLKKIPIGTVDDDVIVNGDSEEVTPLILFSSVFRFH
jgi:hypothetical protein